MFSEILRNNQSEVDYLIIQKTVLFNELNSKKGLYLIILFLAQSLERMTMKFLNGEHSLAKNLRQFIKMILSHEIKLEYMVNKNKKDVGNKGGVFFEKLKYLIRCISKIDAYQLSKGLILDDKSNFA